MSCETNTASILRAAGQKVTPQRLLILSCLRHARGHITAPQVMDVVRATYPFVDASTVYRTLASAKDLGLVSETRLGRGDGLFEWIGEDHHHHLVCRSCGSISILEEQQLESLAVELKRSTGFVADMEHLAIFGVCRDCAVKAEAV